MDYILDRNYLQLMLMLADQKRYVSVEEQKAKRTQAMINEIARRDAEERKENNTIRKTGNSLIDEMNQLMMEGKNGTGKT